MTGVTLRSAPRRTRAPATVPEGHTELLLPLTGVAGWRLGACDATFIKGNREPSYVELLVHVPLALDASRFVAAVRRVLDDDSLGFGRVCGRRSGADVRPSLDGGGLRVSHVVAADERSLDASPPADALFEPPTRAGAAAELATELATLRLTTATRRSCIGLVWDHALADVGGAAQLLAHIGDAYGGLAQPAPPVPP